jgi:ComF family protein
MTRHVFYEPAPPPVARSGRAGGLTEWLLDAGAHFLLPSWCSGCDVRLPWRPSPLGLCPTCRRDLPRPPSNRCPWCAATTPQEPRGRPCPSCQRRPPAFDGLVAAWSYRPPIDEVIRRLKYGRLEFLADDLGAGLAAAVGAAAGRHDWVTAVPLHWRRRRARGYDQAALLAVATARGLGLPYRSFLVRVRSTPPQVSRTAALRRANLAGAFRCRIWRAAALAGADILLVDDVATTGATLDAASRALKAGGAARVTAAVAALTRTPSSAPKACERRG